VEQWNVGQNRKYSLSGSRVWDQSLIKSGTSFADFSINFFWILISSNEAKQKPNIPLFQHSIIPIVSEAS